MSETLTHDCGLWGAHYCNRLTWLSSASLLKWYHRSPIARVWADKIPWAYGTLPYIMIMSKVIQQVCRILLSLSLSLSSSPTSTLDSSCSSSASASGSCNLQIGQVLLPCSHSRMQLAWNSWWQRSSCSSSPTVKASLQMEPELGSNAADQSVRWALEETAD